MPNYSKKIIYLSDAQRQELFANDTVTVNGVTITYNENDIYVTPQAEPVTDVKINGTSITSNGSANIPVASSNIFGVAKVNDDGTYGVRVNNGQLQIKGAVSTSVKNGNSGNQPITPLIQHESTFYGLSKVAGVDLVNETITLGIYPDTSKAAIQKMLGIDTLLAPNETDPFTSAHAVGEVFTMNGKLYRAKTAIAAADSFTLDTNVEEANAASVFVRDVQVNGTSILQNGVANVPKADGSTNGVVMIGNGLSVTTGKLAIYETSDQFYKSAFQTNAVIINKQHLSTFYGLAKAAGDTTQSASSNAVGTYTDSAKAAIQSMLGITQTLTVTVNTQDNVTVTGQTVYVREDDANGPIYAQAAYEGQPVSFAVPSGFHYYVSVSDTLAHHFNPTTATGIITNTNISVTLQYSDFSSIQSAADIKAALNADLDLTDLVGETITCAKGTDTLTWDVVDYDNTNKIITLLLHDAFGSANMVFEPAQALMWCENGLAAGDYTFKWNTTQCYFTLTQAIPAGGQLRATNSAFSTYESQSATATIETGTVSTTEITGATDLGTTAQGLLNHHDRVNYGSNNYAESALYWWLNSDAAANTPRTPVTKFSRAYSYNVTGFMNGLDASFVSCLDDTVWKCSTNNVYECPSSLGGVTPGKQNSYTVTAKFGLASEMEIFGSYGGTADGSVIFDLYNNASADDRKKYRNTTAQNWWLRSPGWSIADGERYVYSSGGANYNHAYLSYAVVPACRISKDV